MNQPAVFLDRDGTINFDVGYAYLPNQLQILPGVAESLIKLKAAGYLLIVVTNQSGVARGMYREEDVRAFHDHLNKRLEEQGSPRIDAFYYCPHLAEGSVKEFAVDCECRKPKAGMIKQALQDHPIDSAQSWMIGDSDRDIVCADLMSLKSIRLGDANDPKVKQGSHGCVRSFAEATKVILQA